MCVCMWIHTFSMDRGTVQENKVGKIRTEQKRYMCIEQLCWVSLSL